MRRLCLAALLTLPMVPVAPAAERICDQSESRLTPSPDGKWTASVQEEVCSTDAGGAAAGITVVLVPATDVASRKRVFIMPVPRSRDDWPRIRWQSASTMEIRIPNLSEAGAPEPEHAGIRILLTHCDDNPDDRARLATYRAAVQQWQKDVTAWVQRRNLDPAAGAPSPPQPEEPRLPRGRCHD